MSAKKTSCLQGGHDAAASMFTVWRTLDTLACGSQTACMHGDLDTAHQQPWAAHVPFCCTSSTGGQAAALAPAARFPIDSWPNPALIFAAHSKRETMDDHFLVQACRRALPLTLPCPSACLSNDTGATRLLTSPPERPCPLQVRRWHASSRYCVLTFKESRSTLVWPCRSR